MFKGIGVVTGYIKTTIDFSKIEKAIEAGKALDNASETEKAQEILKKMAETILKEIK